MKTIRKNVFETNSSSAHVITFSSKGSGAIPKKANLNLEGGSYDWEECIYSSPQDKFSYWFSAFEECATNCSRQISSEKDIKETDPSWKKLYFEVIYNQLALVLTHLRNMGVDFSIFYDDREHELEEYLIDFQNKNKDSDENFNFLVDMGSGIDHQSAPYESSDAYRLGMSSPEEVFDWVYGDGEVQSDNDNH